MTTFGHVRAFGQSLRWTSRPNTITRHPFSEFGKRQELYQTRDNYSLTLYVAGVAVESMLRAYLLKKKTDFESRHDVQLLLHESGMLDVGARDTESKGTFGGGNRRLFAESGNCSRIVSELWHNNYRYASEERLLAHLKRKKLYRKAKGDVLKANALRLLNAAKLTIARGILQWR